MHAPADLVARARTLVELVRGQFVARDRDTIATQVQLAEIPAPTGSEGPRATFVSARFKELGYRVTTDPAGNVVATLPEAAAGAPIVVCAHLDTVFPASVAHRVDADGTRLVGPGISDNARGLTGMLTFAALYATLRPRPPHPVILAATVAEEGTGDLAGARALFAPDGAGARARAAFALDGAGDERIVTHAVGVRRLSVHFQGCGGHSWAASEISNPIHAAACFAADVSRIALPDAPRTTVTVTRITGGHAVNAIPIDAWVDLEVRSSSASMVEDLAHRIERAAHLARERETAQRQASGALSVTIATTSNRPAGHTPTASPPVQALLAATEAIGRTPEFAMASTDANIPISLGIPAVSLGMGGVAGLTHTPREWFENREGALGIARAAAAILMTAGLS